jgi:hypothetical protein
MYLCYIDESGTSDIPGNSSHFVLAGLSLPIEYWKSCDRHVGKIKSKYDLDNAEIHVAWLLRPYLEQTTIPNFEKLSYKQRRSKVEQLRKAKLLQLQRAANSNLYHQTKKNFRKTEDYVHLTYSERKDFISELAHCISEWGFARLFAECVDKIYFDPTRREQIQTIDEQCFEQVVSRFEHYLQLIGAGGPKTSCGMLIHDNNETVARKLTDLMKQFYQKGTMWTKVKNIIETPLFVDSQLTSMVQLADLCAYALRRYLENSEEELFNLVIKRADRKDNILVGVRHYTQKGCQCQICSQH